MGKRSLSKWKIVLKKLIIILCKIEIETSQITLCESCSLDWMDQQKMQLDLLIA